MKRIIKILNDKNYDYAIFDKTMIVKKVKQLEEVMINYINVSKSLIITYDLEITFKDEFIMPIIVFCNEYNRTHNIGCMEYDYANKQIAYSIKNNIMGIDIDENYIEYLFKLVSDTVKYYKPRLNKFNDSKIEFKELLESLEGK